MTNLQAVQTIGAVFLTGAGSILIMLVVIAVMPASAAARVTPWVTGELGTPGAYREPADPAHVDSLIRAYASAPVIYRPDPLPIEPAEMQAAEVHCVYEGELCDLPTTRADYSNYQMTLADLLRSARAQQLVINTHPAGGQHRAPELIAA